MHGMYKDEITFRIGGDVPRLKGCALNDKCKRKERKSKYFDREVTTSGWK